MDASDKTNSRSEDEVAIVEHADVDSQIHDDEDEDDALPTLELNAHHLQVRALNFWAGLLDEGDLPLIEAFSPADDTNLSQYTILLDMRENRDRPSISHLGQRLAEQCETTTDISTLAQAPRNSILALLPYYCNPVVSRRAPTDFEATCLNRRGQSFHYNGMMLPFSSGDGKVDFIYGVISWSAEEFPVEETTISQPTDELVLGEEYLIREEVPEEESGLPRPDLSLLDREADAEDGLIDKRQANPLGSTQISAMSSRTGKLTEPKPSLSSEGNIALVDWLAEARRFALVARDSEERSRNALYQAISMAYDFSLAVTQAPDEFLQLISEAGLTIQERAPFTPLVKLVFGATYEKSRLAEYAAAIAHAHRLGLERGMFGEFLANAKGGLKGIVNAERQLKRIECGKVERTKDEPRASLVKKLLEIEPKSLSDLTAEGDEFTLVLAHRLPEGRIVMLGEVPRDVALLERAARKLVNAV